MADSGVRSALIFPLIRCANKAKTAIAKGMLTHLVLFPASGKSTKSFNCPLISGIIVLSVGLNTGHYSANPVTVQIAFKFEQNKAKNVSLYA